MASGKKPRMKQPRNNPTVPIYTQSHSVTTPDVNHVQLRWVSGMWMERKKGKKMKCLERLSTRDRRQVQRIVEQNVIRSDEGRRIMSFHKI